jgi:hypothetical protein
MIACSSCGCHVRTEEQTCPHCSTPLGSRSPSLAVVVLGLSLAGACVGEKTTTGESTPASYAMDYGTTVTDTDTDADSDSDTDTDTDTDSDADTDTGQDTGAG